MPRAKMPTTPTNRPKRAKPEPVVLLPSGTLIARVEIPARAVPWSVPTTNRWGGARKSKSLVAWQRTVGMLARLSMGGRKPYAGPVRLVVCVELKRKPGTRPDVTNIQKGLEDPLQGIVIVNDRQVAQIETERIIGDRDYVEISVFSL